MTIFNNIITITNNIHHTITTPPPDGGAPPGPVLGGGAVPGQPAPAKRPRHDSGGRPAAGMFVAFHPFMPTVPTFAVRETDVSRLNGGIPP